jgi:hypothetical protein
VQARRERCIGFGRPGTTFPDALPDDLRGAIDAATANWQANNKCRSFLVEGLVSVDKGWRGRVARSC